MIRFIQFLHALYTLKMGEMYKDYNLDDML